MQIHVLSAREIEMGSKTCVPKLWIESDLFFEKMKKKREICDIVTCGIDNLEIY